MTKTIFIAALLISSFCGFSQTIDTIPNNSNDATIYTSVDSVAVFPGGRLIWNKFVETNMNAGVGTDNGAKKGVYKVVIKFTVTKDGALKDFVPVTKYGYGFEEEVIRVLKLSPNWIPAKKNGVNVNSKVEQPMTFVISYG